MGRLRGDETAREELEERDDVVLSYECWRIWAWELLVFQ